MAWNVAGVNSTPPDSEVPSLQIVQTFGSVVKHV